MNRWWFILLSLMTVTVLAVTATGYQGGTTAPKIEKGTLTFKVTDAPPKAEVTSIMITLSRLEVHKAGAEQEPTRTDADAGEWLNIDIPAEARTFDLLKIKGIEELLATAQVAEGKYTQVRITVAGAEVGLAGGAPQPATVPSGVLRIVHPFDVVAGETTTLVLDFDGDRMVTVTGSNKIQIKPVVRLMVKPPAKQAGFTQKKSQEIAEAFVKNSPTFAFDGMAETLKLVESKALEVAQSWQFTYAYECRQAGYGDRTGQMLAQVITPHQIVIRVEKGTIISAVIDSKWDELIQEEIAPPATN